MTVTLEQAKTENEFHVGHRVTSRGRVPLRWRRNGRTQLWKTRPDAFRIPVKFGLRDYGYITNWTDYAYVARLCPVCNVSEVVASS